VGSAASGESRAGDAGESGRDHDFDRDAAAALGAVIGDFGRRLSLLSDRQNSMMQSAGMLLAFASILLIETVRLIFEGAGDALAIAALLCFLSSCAICVWTIWGWKNWELNMGADPDDILDIFNEWKWIDLQHSLLYGAVMSSRIMADKNYILRRMIAYMIAPLLAGVALIMADVARHLI
jgi:hypothetical protein